MLGYIDHESIQKIIRYLIVNTKKNINSKPATVRPRRTTNYKLQDESLDGY